MPWVKLDDGFPFHRKAILAGKDGRALYITALCWTSGQLTDGFIDNAAVPMLAAISDVANYEATVKQLASVGLWELFDGGYQIHDYHDYNPSSERVKEIRKERAKAGHRGGIASGESRREANDEAKQEQKRTPSPSPSPSPCPVPEPKEHGAKTAPVTFNDWQTGFQEASNKAGFVGDMLTALYPYYKTNKINFGMLARMLKDGDADYILLQIFQTSARPPVGDPIKFIAGILKRQPDNAPRKAKPIDCDDATAFFKGAG